MTTIDRDYQAKARAAMELAAAATSDTDRLEWLRVAVARGTISFTNLDTAVSI